MGKISLLDCTLRDGGYVNQWKFGKKTIQNVIQGLVEAEIEIIECGFLTAKAGDENYSLFSSEKDVDALVSVKGNSKLAAMIAIGEKEMDPSLLGNAADSALDIVRITFHGSSEEMDKAFHFARVLMDKGYLVCMQPVGTTGYQDMELIRLMERINELRPYAFYLVDTLGQMGKKDVLRMLYLIDHNLDDSIAIGFHSHNNLQLSLANAQELISFGSEKDILIDSSVFGMGRGAGNLNTEVIADHMNKTYNKHYDLIPILQLIDERIMSIYAEHPWGYSAAYFLSATKGCHPNYASYLLDRQTVHMPDIGRMLDSIAPEDRLVFHKPVIEKMYLEYQKHVVDDSKDIAALKPFFEGKTVLAMAPGRSMMTEQKRVQEYIQKEKPVVLAVNFTPSFPFDWVFVSNTKRFSSLHELDPKKTIVSSNVRGNDGSFLTVNYTDLLNSSPLVFDQAGLLLLKLLVRLGVTKVALAGFDGFGEIGKDNYFDAEFVGAGAMDDCGDVNRETVLQLRKRRLDMEIEWVTDSIYQKLDAVMS